MCGGTDSNLRQGGARDQGGQRPPREAPWSPRAGAGDGRAGSPPPWALRRASARSLRSPNPISGNLLRRSPSPTRAEPLSGGFVFWGPHAVPRQAGRHLDGRAWWRDGSRLRAPPSPPEPVLGPGQNLHLLEQDPGQNRRSTGQRPRGTHRSTGQRPRGTYRSAGQRAGLTGAQPRGPEARRRGFPAQWPPGPRPGVGWCAAHWGPPGGHAVSRTSLHCLVEATQQAG